MKSLFDLFRRRFKKWYQPDSTMQKRLKSLMIYDKDEISCDEVFIVLDQFVEAVHRGENVLLFMPLIRQHLEACTACRVEYEVLLAMLQPKPEGQRGGLWRIHICALRGLPTIFRL